MIKLNVLMFAFLSIFLSRCNEEPYPQLKDGLYAEFQTNKGNFVTELYYEDTPMTVANFVALAEGNHPKATEKFQGKRFYDGITFHRVIDGFMIQGGDPDGSGSGGPGTNGSQFFITLAPTPHLDGKHTVFGKIQSGMEVVKAIGKVEKGARDKPIEDVVINHVNIIRKGKKAKAFDAPDAFTEEMALFEERKQQKVADAMNKFNSLTEGFEETESGLRYKITQVNERGSKPNQGDRVAVHYKGTFMDGNEFDSSYGKGNPLTIAIGVGQVIPGWDEGIMLLREGEKASLAIPSELAYGERGVGPIPPNTPLFFEVELVKIVK